MYMPKFVSQLFIKYVVKLYNYFVVIGNNKTKYIIFNDRSYPLVIDIHMTITL